MSAINGGQRVVRGVSHGDILTDLTVTCKAGMGTWRTIAGARFSRVVSAAGFSVSLLTLVGASRSP
jgi:hypothetical protein